MRRIKKLKNCVEIAASAAVGGRKEGEGPLRGLFDFIDRSDTFGKSTWEQAEGESQALALNFALHKCNWREEDLDVMLAGDLLNQCASSDYGLLDFNVPFLGVFGACSTSAEGLLIASLLLDGGHFERAAVISSSHFCSAERQFRSPVEYGGQRAPTAQWTVTGAGAFLLDRKEAVHTRISDVMIGKTVDRGIDDPANMGAAMAPAAFDTLCAYFAESDTAPTDYDLILTGDLGREGSGILEDLCAKAGYDLRGRHSDCGLRIFDREKQDVHAGGSGCGCAASVLAAEILPEMERGRIQNLLFMATGALMSADAVKQGLTIPGIAHLVHFVYK